MSRDDFEDCLNYWSPEIRRALDQLGYLDDYLANREIDREHLEKLARPDGVTLAATLWADLLGDALTLRSNELILVLEHFRRHPAAARLALRMTRSRDYGRTLANVSFRAADSVYEDAKDLMSRGDIDRAMSRFAFALDEFRFAIQSDRLTSGTLRLAYGKYATAVAFSGRWRRLSAATLKRALEYSKRSQDFGNLGVATIAYRTEILLQAFDLLGERDFLDQALALPRSHPEFAGGTAMEQAEVRIRVALTGLHPDARAKYLENAEYLLRRSSPSSQFDQIKKLLLQQLLHAIRNGFRPPPDAVGIPDGLVAALQGPEREQVATVVSHLVDVLYPFWKNERTVSAAITSVRLLRGLRRISVSAREPQNGARYLEVTSWVAALSGMDRHLHWEAASAALDQAVLDADSTLAWKAHDQFVALIDRYPRWPLPRIGLAKVAEALAVLEPSARSGTLPRADESWQTAARLAIDAPDYREESLGGRNSVYAVEDARGFMSESFVFKPMTLVGANLEAETLGKMARAIGELTLGERFAVPASLAVVPQDEGNPSEVVHVLQRAQGVEIGSLDVAGRADVLSETLELLSIFHEINGRPELGRSPWRPLKDTLRLCLRSLDPADLDAIVGQFKALLPTDLPLVMKRDAHGGNWLQDDAGRIIAIDMESSGYLPIGHDVAQLIEDSVMLPVNRDSWDTRLREWQLYQARLGMVLTPDVSVAAYEWFALYRAVWLGTAREATKMHRRHARELSAWLSAEGDSGISAVAGRVGDLLIRAESRRAEAMRPRPPGHTRVSKGLARLLRHKGPEDGIPVDAAGFASIDIIAERMGVSADELSAVVEHPAELRFQKVGGQVRALYGHSLPVQIDAVISTERPELLYHGTSWDHLEGILNVGIQPMSRQKVHLSASVEEALEIGCRHGPGVVFEVEMIPELEPVPVADGLWVTELVPAEALSLTNPFSSFVGRST